MKNAKFSLYLGEKYDLGKEGGGKNIQFLGNIYPWSLLNELNGIISGWSTTHQPDNIYYMNIVLVQHVNRTSDTHLGERVNVNIPLSCPKTKNKKRHKNKFMRMKKIEFKKLSPGPPPTKKNYLRYNFVAYIMSLNPIH